MSASFLHGVEVIEVPNGPAPITVVKSSVIGLVGTAPSWAVVSPASAPPPNAPTLVSSTQDAMSFGPLVQGYTIPYALHAIQAQGAGQVIAINVLDPARHYSDLILPLTFNSAGAINLGHMGVLALDLLPTATTAVSGEAHTFAATSPSIQLAHGNLQNATVTVTSNPAGTTYVQGTDYTVDQRTGVISRVSDGAITATEAVLVSYSYYSGAPFVPGTDYTVDMVNGVAVIKQGGAISPGASVIASFSVADPSRVQDSDIIGAIDGTAFTGIQAFLTSYGSMGFFPKLLIAPGYSQNSDVASALVSVAEKMRAMALLDSAPNTSAATAISNRGLAGNAFAISSTRAILCYPQETFYDTGLLPTGVTLNGTIPVATAANQNAVGPYSQWVAGAIAAKDLSSGYWWSPSNTQVNGILGPDVTLYASLLNAASDVNNLNAAGILTVFNAFGSGMRVWGNRSAGYPSVTTPDNFISVRRTMDVIEEAVQLSMLQFMDQPISNALITAILASINSFVRTLIQRGALIGGSASYNPAENPPAQVAAGQLVFDIDVMPPPPAERLTFNVYIDTTLLSQLGGTSAMITSASAA
jgi:phage tail sheath protein FI